MIEIKYLETSEYGLRWMRSYYARNAQLEFEKVLAALKQAELVLKEHPYSGRKFEAFDNIRQYQIGHSAFALLYTVARQTVWIIDVQDTRGMRSADALRDFNKLIRNKYDL